MGRGFSVVVGNSDVAMTIVRVRRLSGRTQHTAWRCGAVEGLLRRPGGTLGVCLIILTRHRLDVPIRGVVGGVLRSGGSSSDGGGSGGSGGGICRLFNVNVCEVREWSVPGVAA